VSVPIQVDGETVGAIQLRSRMPDWAGRNHRNLPEQLSDYLLVLALGGGVVGITFSVVASRSLTAPLGRLAAAAHEIGRRNFRARVEPKGSDEMVEVAQAFNSMATRLEEAETLRRHLVADVAHELRTPLSVLQGNLRAILDDVYPLEKEEITRLYTQTRLLGRLVNDLHELAQAEAGQLSLNRLPTDLAQLVRETVEVHEPIAAEADVKLLVAIDEPIPNVLADAARLTQVLHNLLANASRHTPAGGTIAVSLTHAHDAVWLAVKDSGEGISNEHLPYVFDRFYRTDRARTRDTGGAGLGLAIVRAIVVAHGGQVQATSEGSGRGSIFTVYLPLDG
jgi:signal transduction histidine kinase